MEDKKLGLLKKLESFLTDELNVDEASLFTKEELNAPMDVLRALVTDYGPGLIDVMAEFSFIPFEGPEEVLYLSSILTIKTDVPKDGVSALAGAASRLNFYLPCGAFCVNPSGDMLVFKNTTLLRSDHPDDILFGDMTVAADRLLSVPESYTDLLIKVSEGKLLLNDFINTLPGQE